MTYALDTIDLAGIAYKSSYEIVFYAATTGGTLQIIDTANANAVVATLGFLGPIRARLSGWRATAPTGTDIDIAAAPYATRRRATFCSPASPVAAIPPMRRSSATNHEGSRFAYFFTNVTGQPYSAYDYDYSAGNDFIGSKFFYTDVTGEPYTGYEYDYDGGGNVTRVDFTGVTGAAYSSYEYDFVGGVFAGSKFEVTTVPTGATYSSYELDYNSANAFTGDKFFFTNLPGQSYTGEEEDFDASGKLARVLLTGVTGQAYSSLEEDYSAGTYTGLQGLLHRHHGPVLHQRGGRCFGHQSAREGRLYRHVEHALFLGRGGLQRGCAHRRDLRLHQCDGGERLRLSGRGECQRRRAAGNPRQQQRLAHDHRSWSGQPDLHQHRRRHLHRRRRQRDLRVPPIYGSDTITDFYEYTSGATHDTISLVNVGIRQLRGGDGSGDECRKQCGHQGHRRRYADARRPQHDDARRPLGGLHVPRVR